MKEDDDCVIKSRRILERLEDIDHEEIINTDFFGVLYEEEKSSIYFCLFLQLMRGASNILSLFLFQFLISASIEKTHDKPYLYLLALLAGFGWLLTRCSFTNTFYSLDIFYQVQRQILMMIMYEKVSKVSEFVIRSKEIGKIYNLLMSDFNIIESYIRMAYPLVSFPL